MSKLFISLATLTILATPALAQPAGSASPSPYLCVSEPDTAKLVGDRKKFIREIYSPSPTEIGDWDTKLVKLSPAQDAFQKEYELTFHRIGIAMTLAATDSEAQNIRDARVSTFKAQLGRMYARAPLSLTSIMHLVEATLPPDVVKQAHDRLAAKFHVAITDMTNVDALTAPPFVPGNRPELPPPPAGRPTPTMNREQLNQMIPTASPMNTVQTSTPQTEQTPTPPAQPLKPNQPPLPVTPPVNAAPPPAPEVAAPPAPPIPTWKTVLDSATSRYNFKADQKLAAESIYKSCMSRAEAYQNQNKTEIEKTQPGSKERSELTKPLNRIYSELQQRVDAVASIEQRVEADKKAAGNNQPTPKK